MKLSALCVSSVLVGATALASVAAIAPASAKYVNRNVHTQRHYAAHGITAHHHVGRRYVTHRYATHRYVGRRAYRYGYGYGPGAVAGAVVGGRLAPASQRQAAMTAPTAIRAPLIRCDCPSYGYYGPDLQLWV